MRFVVAVILLAGLKVSAQNYHAVQGSPYAGSLGIANNPASMLSNPINWDVTLIGTQLKGTTNIFTIYNYLSGLIVELTCKPVQILNWFN